MAAFVLHDGDWGEYKLTFLPQLEKDNLILIMMDLAVEPGKTDESEQYEVSYNYDDVVLLRDYLTSVIDLYDKKEAEKEIMKKAVSSILNNRSSQ